VAPHLLAWLNLVVRWAHVIVGVAWIGTSFYFNWLNSRIAPPAEPEAGVRGELWSVHGGGFYRSVKYEVAPGALPTTLHWFKWEAYSTWLTGVALLILVYYLQAGAYLIDPTVRELSTAGAVTIGVGAMVGSWLVYDALCRSPLVRRPLVLAALVFALAVLLAWTLAATLSGRAAYIHVGAALGTIMAANVFFVIIPGQRHMVAAMMQGEPPDAARGEQGAVRSLHNNYFTLPVLFVMVSNHYPFTYGGSASWIVLLVIAATGIAARHAFNLRNRGRRYAWLLPGAAMMLVALAFATSPRRADVGETTGDTTERVAYPIVAAIVEQRCVPCHAAEPTLAGYTAPPLGVRLDTPERVRDLAMRIEVAAVTTHTMPLGNLTGMTDEERAVLGRWIREGAELR